MEIKLGFHLTFVSGETYTQNISVAANPNHPFETQAKALIQQMLGQYASIGFLQHDSGKYKLVLPSQIATVECELPSILIASADEVPKVTLD